VSTHYYQINKQVSAEEEKVLAHIKAIAIENKHSYGKRRYTPRGQVFGFLKITEISESSSFPSHF